MAGTASARHGVQPIFDSRRRPSSFVEEFASLVRYRDLISQLVSRSVKVRYKRSVLGVGWTMVNPLLTMVVLTLVFSGLFRFPSRTYALYALSGLLAWNFFAQTTTAAMSDLIWSGGLIGRVQLPKSVFAVAAAGTGLVNLALALVPYAVIALVLGQPPTANWLWLPLPIAALAMFSLGVGLTVSALAVYFPDVMPTYEILLTAWMYLTPIIYPVELIPPNLLAVLRLNPLFAIVQSFRSVLYQGRPPEASMIAAALATGAAMLLAGWWIFTRRAREFAYRV
jgi:ABC-2 type transport system permease protein